MKTDKFAKIIKESGINFSGSFLGKVLGYIWLILITRALTPGELGTFTLAQTIINISLIFVLFGTPKALDRFIPFYNASGEEGKTKTLIDSVSKITLTVSLLVGLVLFFCSDFLAVKLFNNYNLSGILKIMVFSVPLLAFIRIISYSFIGFKELRYRVYFQSIANPGIKIIMVMILLFMGLGLMEWTWMYILTLILTTGLALWFFKRNILSHLQKFDKKKISIGKIFSYSWPLSINSVILIILAQIDFLFLGMFRASSEIGTYRIFTSLVIFLSLVCSSFAGIYKPVISESISLGKKDEVNEIYRRVSKWIFIIVIYIFAVFVLLGKDIVEILFTESYLFMPAALYILAAGKTVNSSVGPSGMTLEAFGNTKLLMLNSLIMFLINGVLDYLLVPQYGILGASIATACSLTVVSIVVLFENFTLHSLFPYSGEHFKFLGSILFSGVVIFLFKRLLPANIFSLIFLLIIMFVVYIAVAYLFKGFDEIDRKMLYNIKEKFRGRESNAS